MRHLAFTLLGGLTTLAASACPSAGQVEDDDGMDPLRADASIVPRDGGSDAAPDAASDGASDAAPDAAVAAFCPIPGCPAAALPAGIDLLGIYAAPAGDVWAVGGDGRVGRRVPDAPSGPGAGTWCWCQSSGSTLRSVWGSASDDVWMVGDAGTVLHFDGTAVVPVTGVGTTAALHDVWGSAATDVFVVGDAGTVRHFDGTAWETLDLDVDAAAEHALRHVWGASAGQVWAVGRHPLGGGSEAEIFRFDAAAHSFTLAASFSESMGAASFDGLGGGGANDVWAVGHKFPSGAAMPFAFAAHFDGSAWTIADAPEEARIGRTYTDVAVQPAGTWFTASGDTCVRYDGATWSAEGSSTTNLLAIDARAGRLFATGRGGKILRHDAPGQGTWTTEVAPTVP